MNSKAPAEMVRVNTRISKQVNDFLDEKSASTGVPKSTWIYLALEQWMNQQNVMQMMPQLNTMMEKLNELEVQLVESKRSDS